MPTRQSLREQPYFETVLSALQQGEPLSSLATSSAILPL